MIVLVVKNLPIVFDYGWRNYFGYRLWIGCRYGKGNTGGGIVDERDVGMECYWIKWCSDWEFGNLIICEESDGLYIME